MAGEPDSAPQTNTVSPEFDDDSIAEIVSRLPAKSLLRFRCVRKSWRALISNPSFVKQHLSKVNTNHRFNLLVGTRPSQASVVKVDDDGDVAVTQELKYPVTSDFPDFFPVIYGSCNGLICMEFEMGNIILWNPCTREFKQLPQPELDGREYDFVSFVCFAGFGYDSTIADFKVIRATKIYEKPTTLQVFTLKTGSWRTITDFNRIREESECIILREKQGFLLNETLHWVALLSGAEYEEGTLGIVSIGLAEEKFQVMALLPCGRPAPNSPVSTSVVMVGNSLFVYHEFGIWLMKEYGVEESWTEVACISPVVLPDQHFNSMLTPLCICDNGEVLLNHRQALGVYNPEGKTFRSVTWNCEEYSPQCVAYVETLVSPLNCIGGTAQVKVENKGAKMELLSL
ncbi:putative F-box domain-containing protein [Rosa chinensis]|uniref:Putative F-box domain-containing protein n=1 Tax=Rosa chinensis TaxID=74649 RepID=A0A2P6Q3L8_ROSCH|nr:F-box/kelch-repeat protein At3g23880 [Rosa chinensis]XP_040361303.1 F-box/kelch-repeat protein At3g23880 [Rosa chinensis]XP_040361304.1 F-box/kelch-repeat protein At3g23880 [Rosa chinensis]PRQ28739.1 putative F-box domain-containing protein [Rosa chinensis]